MQGSCFICYSYKNMKKFKKILPYVVVIALGVGLFYGMTYANISQPTVGFGQAGDTAGYGVA